MNKQELVDKVAEKTDLSKKDAKAALEGVFETIEENLANGNDVRVHNFGTFQVQSRKITGNETRATPKFKPARNLKYTIQNSDK